MNEEYTTDPREKFEAAMKEYLAALGKNDGLVIDWMLVVADHIIPDGGGSATGLAVYVSESQSLYRTSGLARYAMMKTDERMKDPDS